MEVDRTIGSDSASSLCAMSIALAETINCNAFAEATLRIRPKTILLAEDEEFVRRLASEVLQSAGYIVVTAGSAAEALRACRKYGEPIDLLLTDVVMPGMSGRELAKEFGSFYPSGEVLLMSGYPEQLAFGALSTGKRRYLVKPFSADLLLQRVREILEV